MDHLYHFATFPEILTEYRENSVQNWSNRWYMSYVTCWTTTRERSLFVEIL